MSDQPAPARPSASVVIARDGGEALEVLLLRRNQKIAFHGGAWVFPGGRVDRADGSPTPEDELETAKRAAAREAFEEAGLELSVDDMLPFAHWTTPVELPKRFATWFFASVVKPDCAIQIDESEIIDYRWMTPRQALDRHIAGDLSLPGPTFVTLLGFSVLGDSNALRNHLESSEIQRFVPRLVSLDEGRCTLYHEDAGYKTLDPELPGPRHRLIMQGTDWRYLRDF